MNAVHSTLLAGDWDVTTTAWITMFNRWGELGLRAGLIILVVVGMMQKFSVKAGIGALILMVIAMGLYNSRNDLADMFEDEVKNPAKGAPAVPGIVRSADPLTRAHSDGAGGWL